ncbi:MAG TPA: FAD-dependent oxidoreductase [Candidatus Methylomirabilis sp.]|nr:FAD-dependent oxidoreductase [Candidatus Methylomirabilis sp.]
MKSRVLVLGAGFGGMELSTLLSEALGETADVTVIEKSDAFIFGYSKIDVMFGRATPEAVRLPYRNFVKPGVRFVQETITAIDPAARRVSTTGGTHEADFLVVALGADFDLAATPGLAEDGNEFYSVAGASRAREVLFAFSKGPAIVGVSSFPFKCPPAPSECALMLHDYLTKRGVRGACEITLVLPLSSPMPASADLSRDLVAAFAETGIRLVLGRSVRALEPGRKTAVLDDGTELPYALYLGIPKHQVPQPVLASGLAENGWVPITLRTMETHFPDVYAIGDMAATGLPKAGSFAESAARAAASSILAKLKGGEATPNSGTGSCLVEFGDGRIGWADLDFLTGPKLTSIYHAPSVAGRAHKVQFGAMRRARWFGF